MAARGTEAKEKITNVMMKLFPNGFMDGKTLRIPIKENGEVIEIKVALTAAKDTLGGNVGSAFSNASAPISDMPTEEEIEQVKEYLKSMGMI